MKLPMKKQHLAKKLHSPVSAVVSVITIVALSVLFIWLIWQRLPYIASHVPTWTTFYIHTGDLNDTLDANGKPILKPQYNSGINSIRLNASLNGRTAELPIGTYIALYFPHGRFTVSINPENGILKRIRGIYDLDVINEY